jgi:flagellar hook-basal body complex protein FliE
MTTPSIAANAYSTLARLADPSAALGKAAAAGGGPNFGAVLKDAMNAVVEAGRKSDAQTQAMVAGKANIVDVVTAVSETEVAVEAMVSVRDRMIAAYEETDLGGAIFSRRHPEVRPPRPAQERWHYRMTAGKRSVVDDGSRSP